ncbi:MAG: glycosyltransferase family 39 protein [Bacteroidota bacterium]
MHLPPCGTHVWRQCNTLAMSRNFAEEDMNILHPRIDRRNETSGITGSHFPLFEWLLALASKPFGHHFLLNRLFSLLVSTMALFAFYQLLTLFAFSKKWALAGSLLLLSIPEMYYQSINALPDILALGCALFGMVYGIRFSREISMRNFFLFFLFSVIAGLVKFQFLILPFSCIVCFDLKNKKTLYFLSICTASLSIVLAWYYYALKLTRLNNLREYGLWIKPITIQEKLMTLGDNLIMDLPEILMGWPLFIAALFIALPQIRKVKLTLTTKQILMALAAFIVFYIVAIERMRQHSYYFMPLLPLLIIIALLFAKKKNIATPIVYGLLLLNMTWAMVRIIPSRWVEGKLQIPVEFSSPELYSQFAKHLPANSKCVVGPDISGCIYFYFTHSKGYSFEKAGELLTIKDNRIDIDNMRYAGIQYLIIRNGELLKPMEWQLRLQKKVAVIGEFEIWKL